MKNPESKNPEYIDREFVIAEMRKAYARGEKYSDSTIPLLHQWIKQEQARLPQTPEGAIELKREHAHILASAGFPSIAKSLLDETTQKYAEVLKNNPTLAHYIAMDHTQIDALREINEDMRAMETGWKEVFLNPDKK